MERLIGQNLGVIHGVGMDRERVIDSGLLAHERLPCVRSAVTDCVEGLAVELGHFLSVVFNV